MGPFVLWSLQGRVKGVQEQPLQTDRRALRKGGAVPAHVGSIHVEVVDVDPAEEVQEEIIAALLTHLYKSGQHNRGQCFPFFCLKKNQVSSLPKIWWSLQTVNISQSSKLYFFSFFFFSKYRFFCGQILSRHQTTFVQQPVKNLQRSAPFVSEHCSPSHVTDWQPWRVKQALRLGSGCLPSTLMAPGSSHSSHLYTGTLLLLLLAHAFSLSSPEGNRTQHLRGKRHTGQLVSALVFFPTLRAESH